MRRRSGHRRLRAFLWGQNVSCRPEAATWLRVALPRRSQSVGQLPHLRRAPQYDSGKEELSRSSSDATRTSHRNAVRLGMLWARMARASRAVVARERAWPPNFCYRIADSALENCLSTGCPVGQWQDMSKGKQLREGLTAACSRYAIGDHKVPHSGWMVGNSTLIRFRKSSPGCGHNRRGNSRL